MSASLPREKKEKIKRNKSLPSSLVFPRAPGLKNSEKPDGDSWAVAEPTKVATIMTATTTRLASIVIIIISVARACPSLTEAQEAQHDFDEPWGAAGG